MRAQLSFARRVTRLPNESSPFPRGGRRIVGAAIAIAALAVSACDEPTEPSRTASRAAPSEDLMVFPVGYSMIDLSNWPGSSDATSINAAGTIVGYHGEPGWESGFILSGGTYTSIAPLPTFSNSVPTDINDNGVVVGYSSDYYNFARWVGWVKLPGEAPKPLNQGPCVVTTANAINNVGDIVGFCDSRPAVWHYNGAFTPATLKTLSASDPTGEAKDINDNGLIVGITRSDALGADAAVYWFTPTEPHLIAVYGATSSRAASVSNVSGVAGSYSQGSTQHGFVFGFYVPTKLFDDPAWAISDKGRAIGVKLGSPARAFTAAPGSTTEQLLPVPGSGTSLARAVNDCGTIVGAYYSGSATHAVKWTKTFCDQ
jgi:uncharacterized membrane protein